MSEMVVGAYESRRDADAVRKRLVGHGVDAGRIALEERPRADTSLLARASPRVCSLPNAPTAWHEATAGDPSSTAGGSRSRAARGAARRCGRPACGERPYTPRQRATHALRTALRIARLFAASPGAYAEGVHRVGCASGRT